MDLNCSFWERSQATITIFFEQAHLLASESEEHLIREEYTVHIFRFWEDLPINESNQDLKVQFLKYWESKPGKEQHFTWVTDKVLTEDTVNDVMRGGRSRWKIENETFNTLKNQGCQFEHNFGHGYKNLSVVFALLTMLAFTVNQIQQCACKVFQSVKDRAKSTKDLWEKMRTLFDLAYLPNWKTLFFTIARGDAVITLCDPINSS